MGAFCHIEAILAGLFRRAFGILGPRAGLGGQWGRGVAGRATQAARPAFYLATAQADHGPA